LIRSAGPLCAFALVLHGCVGQPACTDSGEDSLLIPVARLASVTGLRADGACTVGPVPANCTVATRCLQWRGEETAVVTVTGTARGKCTVSVDFNDGCAAEVRAYEFIGPYENCCGDICRKPYPSVAVASSCVK
jgi:hypothetical protein